MINVIVVKEDNIYSGYVEILPAIIVQSNSVKELKNNVISTIESAYLFYIKTNRVFPQELIGVTVDDLELIKYNMLDIDEDNDFDLSK